MPSKSKAQQRFFGMVDAYKKGEMKNASSKIKKAAKGMSMDDVKDFAETKHKGLPEKVEENMDKKIIRMTESDLHRIVKESVTRILNEGEFDQYGTYHSSNEISAMEKAFGNYVKGSDVLTKGVKVLRGNIRPDALYSEEMGVYWNGLLPGDIVIEYPDGRQHTLISK